MNDVDEMPTMNVIHLLALKDNQIFDLKSALKEISEFNVTENYGVRTEHTEATSFKTCKNIAFGALKGNQ